MDGSALNFPMEYVEWKSVTVARKYAGVPAYEGTAGLKRSREIAFIEAGVCHCPGSVHAHARRSLGTTEAESTRDQGTYCRSLGVIRTS